MFKLLRELAGRWGSWVGDRDMELQIRNALKRDGYGGSTAELTAVRLVFIQRPGWIQVYTFDAKFAAAARETRSAYGLLRQDERINRCQVRCFDNPQDRAALLQQWSSQD